MEDQKQKISTSQAKIVLSDLVDRAQHRNETVILTRYNKPAAAIVNLDVLKKAKDRK